jgi:hypothetical protein
MSDTKTMQWSKFGETWNAEADDGGFFTVTFVPLRGRWRLHAFTADVDALPRTRWFRSLDDAKRAAGEAKAG